MPLAEQSRRHCPLVTPSQASLSQLPHTPSRCRKPCRVPRKRAHLSFPNWTPSPLAPLGATRSRICSQEGVKKHMRSPSGPSPRRACQQAFSGSEGPTAGRNWARDPMPRPPCQEGRELSKPGFHREGGLGAKASLFRHKRSLQVGSLGFLL